MNLSERNCDKTPEFIQIGQDVNRLRELILEGMISELNTEPLDAAYFESLRDGVCIQGSKREN
jgi:hypothetical protein